MQQVPLGNQGLKVSKMGLGCMGMSDFYGAFDDAESMAVIHRALERGLNFLDTADMYGVGRNEELIGRAIAGRRDQVVIATKFGNMRDPQNRHEVRQHARPANRCVLGRERQSRVRACRVRGEPETFGCGSHRFVLPAPRGPRDAD